jgi:hypothetical protein
MEIIVRDVECPTCGAGEMHPDGEHILIRGFKVCDDDGYWWSQCLVCAGYYSPDLAFDQQAGDRDEGWF